MAYISQPVKPVKPALRDWMKRGWTGLVLEQKSVGSGLINSWGEGDEMEAALWTIAAI